LLLKACWQTSTGIEELKKQPEGDVTITIPLLPMNPDDCQLKEVSSTEQFALFRLAQGMFTIVNKTFL
jgi:hypothetical protein